MIPRSLRWRLNLAIGAVATVMAASAAVAIWAASARMQGLAFDQAARDHARTIRPRLEEIVWRHARDPGLAADELPGDDGILLLRSESGDLLAASPGGPPPGDLPAHPGPDGVLVDARLPGLGPVRWLVLDIVERPPAGQRPDERQARRDAREPGQQRRNRAQLSLIRPTAPLQALLARQAWQLAGLALLADLVVIGLVSVIVQRLLLPVQRLGQAIDAAVPGGGGMLEVPGLPVELAPVQQRLNALLARVDQLLERERSTTANIAHELRTPLTGLRARLELALLRQRDSGHLVDACRQGLATTGQLQGLVDNLLLLARLEAGSAAPVREAVEIAEIVAAAWALHQNAAEQRGLTFERRIEPALAVITDAAKLRSIVGNLVANAVAYADPGSVITCDAAACGDGVRLSFANAAARIAPADAARVFEPFWRGDAARTVEEGHCGLGLALVQRLVGILGGRIAVEVAGGRFTATLQLPDLA